MAEVDEVQTADASPRASVGAGVGARLRLARERVGLSLADVAAGTRVSERYLSAIEDERFADLASRTYAVGFARAYARHVGLDEQAIATEVRTEMDRHVDVDRPRPVTFDHGDLARVPGRGLAWLAALLAVAVAVGVFFWWRSYYDPAVPVGDLAPPASEAAAVTPSAAPSAAAATPSGAVVFTATQPAIWVKFYDATGKQLMQKQMAQGESYTIPADAAGPKLWTGRPDALQITIGGRPVAPIGTTPGKVKDVPVDAASLARRGAAAPAPGVPAPGVVPAVAPSQPVP